MNSALAGRVALVTGGTRGIGEAIARRLQRDGAHVVVTGAAPTGEGPPGCEFRRADFSDEHATETFVSDIAELGVDILVNNAGINSIAPFEAIPLDDFDRIQRVNVRAPFVLCKAVLPQMKRKGWGRIVNIASVFGIISREQRGAYSASKFALDGLTAALAAEVASEGVLANCVSPGFIETDLTRRVLGADGMAEVASRIPMRRLGTPNEVASLVAWLVSEENSYVSGQNFVIDGGFTRV